MSKRRAIRQLPSISWLLVLAQAIYFASVSVDLTLTAVVGLKLAPEPFLATLPLAAISLSGTLSAFAAGPLAGRLGAVTVQLAGGALALLGGVISASGVAMNSFGLLCVGTALVGGFRATGGYIRYLASDAAPDGLRELAVSVILYGGLVAAFVGPFAATWSAHVLSPTYAGSYLLVALLGAASMGLFAKIARSPVGKTKVLTRSAGVQVPLRAAIGLANFRLGLLTLTVAGALMTMVMAIGPLASHEAGHSDAESAFVIQWHLVGMFAPAIISGPLQSRLGARATGAVGTILMAGGASMGALSNSSLLMVLSLMLNGAGWNFLFLAGTSLITRCYPAGRGGRIQGFVEGVAAVAQVIASLCASATFFWLSWSGVNIAVFILAVATGFSLAFWRRQRNDDDFPGIRGTTDTEELA